MEQNVDEMNLYDLGVTVEGTWDPNGMPTGWEICSGHVSTELPRWLLREPVMYLPDGPDVYIRGMHSKRLSAARAKALLLADKQRVTDSAEGKQGE